MVWVSSAIANMWGQWDVDISESLDGREELDCRSVVVDCFVVVGVEVDVDFFLRTDYFCEEGRCLFRSASSP